MRQGREKTVKNQWRGRAVSTAAIGCEPGQIRKEAAAAIKSSVVAGLSGTATTSD